MISWIILIRRSTNEKKMHPRSKQIGVLQTILDSLNKRLLKTTVLLPHSQYEDTIVSSNISIGMFQLWSRYNSSTKKSDIFDKSIGYFHMFLADLTFLCFGILSKTFSHLNLHIFEPLTPHAETEQTLVHILQNLSYCWSHRRPQTVHSSLFITPSPSNYLNQVNIFVIGSRSFWYRNRQ